MDPFAHSNSLHSVLHISKCLGHSKGSGVTLNRQWNRKEIHSNLNCLSLNNLQFRTELHMSLYYSASLHVSLFLSMHKIMLNTRLVTLYSNRPENETRLHCLSSLIYLELLLAHLQNEVRMLLWGDMKFRSCRGRGPNCNGVQCRTRSPFQGSYQSILTLVFFIDLQVNGS